MQKKILLADDNQSVRLVTKAVLESVGYAVELSSNGQEALAKALTSHYHLILMDIQMPIQDGITTARLIRNHEAAQGLKAIPIVAYSSRNSGSAHEKCIEAGMNDHVYKPADAETLIQTVQKWIL